jgi:hypothetical protein
VLLGSSTNIERRNIDKLRSNTNVSLTDQNTSMMDRLGKTLLVNLGLKTPLQKLLSSKLKDGIKIKLIISKKTVTGHATKKSRSLKDTLGILGVKGEKTTGSLTELGESELYTPDLALASETVLSYELELGIKTLLLERTPGRLIRLAVITKHCVSRHDCYLSF